MSPFPSPDPHLPQERRLPGPVLTARPPPPFALAPRGAPWRRFRRGRRSARRLSAIFGERLHGLFIIRHRADVGRGKVQRGDSVRGASPVAAGLPFHHLKAFEAPKAVIAAAPAMAAPESPVSTHGRSFATLFSHEFMPRPVFSPVNADTPSPMTGSAAFLKRFSVWLPTDLKATEPSAFHVSAASSPWALFLSRVSFSMRLAGWR